MTRLLTAVSILALLSACGDGQPFFDAQGNLIDGGVTTEDDNGDDVEGDGGDLDNDGATPPPGSSPEYAS